MTATCGRNRIRTGTNRLDRKNRAPRKPAGAFFEEAAISVPPFLVPTSRALHPGRPGGSTGTSRARRRVSCSARRVARGSLLLTTGTAYRRA
jgi:hypothetical protein